jgi:crotonobetaine/carnitine-CoA ligase
MPQSSVSIGVDIGGTFTDVVAVDDAGRLRIAKVPSSRADPSAAGRTVLSRLLPDWGIPPAAVERFVHGTTVATNAVLERKGARLGLLATASFPNGVMQAQRYWITQSKLNAFRDGLVYERIMISTPFYYMDPQWLLLMAFHQRATSYIAAKQSTTRYVEWLHKYRTQFSLMPGEVMFKHPPTPIDRDNDVRRVNVYGLRREVHAQVEARFNVNAREAFGMTELGSATFLPLEADHMIGKGSCGIAGPFRECKVVDAEGKEVLRGEIGEMVVRGSGILLGYYKKPEANKEAFFGDWFRTGDLFRQDEAGYFYIVGRLKEMIRRSSENIPAREVEAVLKDMPEIVESAVVGVPDDLRKEEVKAYVILQPGLTKEDVPPEKIIEHARKYLAPFKVPRYIEYRTDFPRTPSLKIRKPELVKEKEDLRVGSWDRVDKVWR